jgi:PKD repeat protein
VATNFGCTNSIQKAVTISTSPVAGFTNLPACVNQATQFTDASSGSIKSRQWQIQGSTFIVPNPQFTYPSSGTFPVILTVTGNNNCVSQATKNIVVPVVPSLDFSVQAPCANSSTVFTELTTSADPSVSKNWSFGSQGTGSGSPAQYAFSTTGTYAVRLNSTRQSGCVYTVSKNVNIVSPPIADFEPSIDAGAAPLPVSFANTSSGASSYLWKFGDQGNSTSVLVSPTFVFSELGAYNVELSASNSIGCTNRLSKPISVVIPTVDAEMTDFFFVKDQKTGSLQPVVKLLNKSNITLTDPTILLDVAGGSSVSQQITGTLKPNQEISQMLDLKLVPKTNQYVCAEVVVAGDSETFLNRKCLSLSGEEVLFSPFPNPAREQLNMDWISIDGSAVTFQVLTSGGAASFQQTISSINPGLNRLIINTSALSPGIYFIRFRDGKTDRTFSFAVAGN